ncbi:MAG: carbamoyltransferase HypF [Gammaproteobacteria bacterium]|nr:carbamoyltransferase HypF [Gammaproteobacteria bacterium]
MSVQIIRQCLQLSGRVQGVGFRPFVYRLARELGLAGWVRNQGGALRIEVEGRIESIEAFCLALIAQAPAGACPRIERAETRACLGEQAFVILPSLSDRAGMADLPLDSYLCSACCQELFDPGNRRYRYPFINCSHCGPRYSLLDQLPYDRANTSMQGFPMCPACTREYQDPRDRRFHAEPIACPDCGPTLRYRDEHQIVEDNEAALAAAIALLRQGGILALKGVAAYQLLCDAHNAEAVARLRQRKQRPDKPLALMYPEYGKDGLDALRGAFSLSTEQAERLRSTARPIVLCDTDTSQLPGIAPGLNAIGVMLPGSPLHALLLTDFGGPLVATSGNRRGEPVVYREDQAEAALLGIADGFLHHNRPIRQRADDPVYRPIAGRLRPLRMGRGDAPVELRLPRPIPQPTLALGGQMKNTVALAWEDRCVLSPHIGDLDSPRALQEFQASIAALQRLYGIEAEQLVVDAHPGYGYWPWARQSGLPIHTVLHHHAHASALYGEYPALTQPILVFTWDGTGYGEDGALWGGEAFLGQPGQWQHLGQMRPLALPGAEQALREPWRVAAALCWQAGLPSPWQDDTARMLQQAWRQGINCPRSSSVGRLFDAASALLGLCHHGSFEGQAAMWLEALAETAPHLPQPAWASPETDTPWQWDWQPLLINLLDSQQSPAARARQFHQALAGYILQKALEARASHGIRQVGLSGGVFQNRLLCQMLQQGLTAQGIEVLFHQQVPCNDAGLAWGQIIQSLHQSTAQTG